MNKLFSAAFAFALAACSTQGSDTSTVRANAGTRIAFALPATLGDVTAQAAPSGATGLSTRIDLNFAVPCTESLETFSYNLRARDDGRVDLLVSAIATRTVQEQGTAHCQSIMLVTKSVTVPGIITSDSINLVNLKGAEATLAPTTKALKPIGVEVVAVRSLCPQGAMCMVGGTIVTLKTTEGVSCLDKIAPVTFAYAQKADGKVELAVGAVDLQDSRAVGCAAVPKTVDISLPMAFATLEDIKLTVVGG